MKINIELKTFISLIHQPNIFVPVSPCVSVKESHVVQKLVGHDTYSVTIIWGEAGEDSES